MKNPNKTNAQNLGRGRGETGPLGCGDTVPNAIGRFWDLVFIAIQIHPIPSNWNQFVYPFCPKAAKRALYARTGT